MTDDTPLVSEYVTGHRAWHIRPGPTLTAVVADYDWAPGDNSACCQSSLNGFVRLTLNGDAISIHDGHRAPGQHCECGLYAYHDEVTRGTFDSRGDPLVVRGAVVGWGDIEVHCDGFRAQHARVVLLCLEDYHDDAWATYLGAVARHYRCKLVRAVDVDAELLEYGKPIPEEMRPQRPQFDRDHFGNLAPGLPGPNLVAFANHFFGGPGAVSTPTFPDPVYVPPSS